jgi:hypothetical protein
MCDHSQCGARLLRTAERWEEKRTKNNDSINEGEAEQILLRQLSQKQVKHAAAKARQITHE